MADDVTGADFPADARIGQSPDALAAEVDGEIVLLNVATGFFHQLNGVGSYLWRQIADPRTIAELGARALLDFTADEAACRQEIRDFVQDLHGRGLVRIL